MWKRKRSFIVFFLILLVGFLTGIALPELIKMNSGTYAGFFSMYSLKKFQQQEIQMRDVFLYILSVRMELLLFLWLSSFTKWGIWVHACIGAWILCTAGILLRLFLLKKGIQGVLMFFCCLMPQWILYGMLWKQEIMICFRNQKQAEISGKRLLLYFFNLAALGICGCACETWLGIQFQKKFFSFFI